MKEKSLNKGVDYFRKFSNPVWLNDDGFVFTCKFCRKVRPINLKSKVKKGCCSLCYPKNLGALTMGWFI